MAIFEKVFQRNDKVFLQLYFIVLGIILYLCFLLAFYLSHGSFKLPDIYFSASIIIVIIFWISGLIRLKGNRYIVGTVQFLRNEFTLLIQTFFISILLTVLLKITGLYSRVWLVAFFVLSLFSMIILKVFFDLLYSYLITSNIIQRNVLLVGDSFNCQNILKNFPKKKRTSVIKCLISIDNKEQDYQFFGIPNFDLTDDLNYILNHHLIGQIWIVSSIKTQIHIEKLVDKFLNFPVDCRLISYESKFNFIEGLDTEAGFDFYNISFSPFYGTNLLIKNILDKILALFFLIISLPLMIISSVIIFVSDGFPIFFKQKRTGWDGKTFYIYKFRTLYKSASDKKLPKSERLRQVTAGDRRVTRVGSILRRFSIDEFPQFFNIIKGDMSLVGPRPHLVEHTSFYSEEIVNFMQRHKCLPGLTGWAQVHGLRGPTQSKDAMAKRFQYDLYYLKNWSLVLDFYIIIRTFLIILFQKVD